MPDLPEADLQPVDPPEASAAGAGSEARRVRAGLLVELGLAPRDVARRWQKAVVEGRFEPDACADEVIAASRLKPDAESRLAGRAARLQRDLVMAPTLRGLRGAGRKAREGARGLVAFVVAQVVTLTVLAAILLVGALVGRVVFDVSYDGFLDSIASLLPD